ncbi:MAG: hypothetical protein ABIS23_04655 [Sphingomicrobium sp.]
MALSLVLLLRAGLASAGLTASAVGPSYGAAEPSLVYLLHREATTFVLSKPQDRVRILTNAELQPGGAEPRYGFLVEALDPAGAVVWRRTIYVRSIPLFVRDRLGKLMPHVFLAERGALQPSAADTTLIDFAGPVSAIRISAGKRDPGVGRILARIQEQRPISGRQLEVGWQRLSKGEQAQLTAGSPLGPSLTSEAERQRLLMERWNPVGPAGVEGRDYFQTIIYERPGPTVTPRDAS